MVVAKGLLQVRIGDVAIILTVFGWLVLWKIADADINAARSMLAILYVLVQQYKNQNIL